MGISIFAAAVDSQEHTQKVAESLGFPVAYGVTREQADLLDSWWDDRLSKDKPADSGLLTDGFIQPSEFLILRGGEVRFSTYSNSPVGRMDAAEMLALMTMVIAGSKK